jgi:hypothetical protein
MGVAGDILNVYPDWKAEDGEDIGNALLQNQPVLPGMRVLHSNNA